MTKTKGRKIKKEIRGGRNKGINGVCYLQISEIWWAILFVRCFKHGKALQLRKVGVPPASLHRPHLRGIPARFLDPKVALERVGARKRLEAARAAVWLVPGVHANMTLQVVLPRK